MNTIALNMIVGPGDADLLERCLQAFDAYNTFDEIIIVLTTYDERCEEIAKRFTNEIFHFTWSSKKYPYGNFAGARNLALQNTHSDYVMWLDCDDLPSNDFLLAFANLKNVSGDYDYYTFDYVISKNISVNRERVFKRIPDLFWQYPVHEQLTIDRRVHTSAHISNIQIVHSPLKATEHSTGRNLQILQHECSATSSPVMQFYLGREFMQLQQTNGVAILEKLLYKDSVNSDLCAQICILLCGYYRAKGQFDNVETLSRIGISYNPGYADFLINLAYIYEGRKDFKGAAELYKKAIDCKFSGGGVYVADYYTFIPAIRLVDIFVNMRKFAMALVYCKMARDYVVNEDRAKVVALLHGILQQLLTENK